jgi:hypothetical protein
VSSADLIAALGGRGELSLELLEFRGKFILLLEENVVLLHQRINHFLT